MYNILLGLLCVSLFLNVVLFIKVRTLSRKLNEVGQRVEITEEELSQIRKRLEKLKGEI
jgi:di/tricarboxylate transporter